MQTINIFKPFITNFPLPSCVSWESWDVCRTCHTLCRYMACQMCEHACAFSCRCCLQSACRSRRTRIWTAFHLKVRANTEILERKTFMEARMFSITSSCGIRKYRSCCTHIKCLVTHTHTHITPRIVSCYSLYFFPSSRIYFTFYFNRRIRHASSCKFNKNGWTIRSCFLSAKCTRIDCSTACFTLHLNNKRGQVFRHKSIIQAKLILPTSPFTRPIVEHFIHAYTACIIHKACYY